MPRRLPQKTWVASLQLCDCFQLTKHPPTTTSREVLQNQEVGFQSMTTTKLRTALVWSSEVTLSLPLCLFPLPEYPARYCYDLDLGWWPKVNTNSLKNEQNKIVKSIFQKHEAAGSALLVPKKLSPCHPIRGWGCYKTHRLSSSSPNRSASSLQSRPQLAPGLAG